MRSRLLLVAVVSLVGVGCESGPRSAYLTTPTGAKSVGSVPGAQLDAKVCDGVVELRPEYTVLDESSLMQFLQRRGYELRRTRARSDLVYVDVLNAGGEAPVRLRVAVLPNPQAAGRELHEAVLDHGPGSWGVHRSNLAVLAPIGDTDRVVAFASKTQLACWGVLTVAGRDDSFVIPGGYIEL